MRYDVHLFPVVRVKVFGVEASDELAAIKRAEESNNFYRLFNRPSVSLVDGLATDTEYAEEVTCYLVDSEGKPDGVWYGPGYERGDANPNLTKARLFQKILDTPKVLPVLIGIDSELDKVIAGKLSSQHG